MRYESGHKEATRERIVESASRTFRAEGIASVGVIKLMGDVGLTKGGFYAHFESKEALASDAVTLALLELRDRLVSAAEEARRSGSLGIEGMIDAYLSRKHLEHPQSGCPIAAIGGELRYALGAHRKRAEDAIQAVIQAIAEELPPSSGAGRAAVAELLLGQLAGTLQLARLATSDEHAERLLNDGRRAARLVAGSSRNA